MSVAVVVLQSRLLQNTRIGCFHIRCGYSLPVYLNQGLRDFIFDLHANGPEFASRRVRLASDRVSIKLCLHDSNVVERPLHMWNVRY